MDNRLADMEVFTRVVATGSFSAAARQLGQTPSAVSRAITRLEERLRVRLLVRSTRSLTPTAEGEAYLAEARTLLDQLEDLESRIGQRARTPRGLLRVSVTVGFGAMVLVPLVPRFLETYPEVELDLTLSDAVVDLWQERTDVALRSGRLKSSALKARRIATMRRVVVASPDYLARRGIPRVPADLEAHACLRYNFMGHEWPFHDPRSGDRILQPVRGPLSASDGTILRQACLAGLGLMWSGDAVVAQDIAAGRLVEVLPDFAEPEPETIHAVFAGHPHLAVRIKAFIDFVHASVG
ncbi:LysR family transcriptional regulator [Paracoccus benzoatiresistens]|uniref:LysR family transcriptional regulator n=1 Tax=Paracoccus benzoatiresistens TaxID=2997341 RepID=A0ABT4J6A9_9RHOB|nr:LysR family transcriptional regulator [Paracoccus sp. EF6]MCZ0962661.1 LysR family transcriptional regulator [Paracoccus sp. EF6]